MTKNTRTRVLINKVHIIKYQLQNISSQRDKIRCFQYIHDFITFKKIFDRCFFIFTYIVGNL